MSAEKKITLLRKELHKHNYLYYMLDKPEISDHEFDKMLKELHELELQFPEFDDSNSPTQRVGSSLNNNFHSITHSFPMYSLENSYSSDELIKWKERLVKVLNSENISYSCELKLDGVSISLSYKKGKLTQGLTRGDGNSGDDVTENIKTINTIPLETLEKVDYDFDIRGEVIIEKNDFIELNDKKIKNGEEPFKNPRNTASGSIKLVSSKEVRKRPLKCYFFQIISDSNPFKTQSESLNALKKLGFNVSNTHKYCKNIDEVFDFINYWDKNKDKLNFEIDGIVIKVNSFSMQKQLGYTSKFPRWAIAYKFQTEQATTKLVNVVYQVGRTGAITPVANLKPVLINGTVVKRASLHNEEQIQKLDLYENDILKVEKGGEIIPKIVSIDYGLRKPNTKKIAFIKNCPACGSLLIKNDDEAQHYCMNSNNCFPQIVGKFKHFISRKAMNIDGFGTETIERLLKENIIKNFSDIYNLKVDQLVKLERMAEKSAQNLVSAIYKSKSQPFHKVLFSLGIRHVGQTVSKKLSDHFGSLENLMSASYEEILNVDEIGDKIALSLKKYFQKESNLQLLDKLKHVGLNFLQTKSENLGNKLLGKTFIITGVFEKIDRTNLKEIILQNGGKISSSISPKSIVIAGNKPGPSKMLRAKDIGLTPISFEEFINLYEIKIEN